MRNTLRKYIMDNFPLDIGTTQYTPFQLGSFLSQHNDTLIDGVRISNKKIINFLTSEKLIPVGQSTAYKIESLVSQGCIPVNSSWTDLSKHGRKALLTSQELMWLVREFRNDSRGGKGIGANEIKERLTKHIFDIWTRKGKLHLIPNIIPQQTLNAFVNKVKSQCDFSTHDNLANKSESRATVEWSMRSALAYSSIVAVNHFIPNVLPTIYHPRKSDLCHDALELWNLSEMCYNKMLGYNTVIEKSHPVLPNLLTTSNEVTTFATTGTINDKQSFYIVARPEELKNGMCHSGSRNHYKSAPTGNAHCRGVRIVVNSTFTAGGLSAPIFIAVYGLTAEEMPRDDIITIDVPGLVSGSHQNIYSCGTGYITCVRGSDSIGATTTIHNADTNLDENQDQSNTTDGTSDNIGTTTYSK